MTVEEITDTNYQEFKQSPRAVLVVGTTTCKNCKTYDPVVNALSQNLPFIRFGKAILDKPGLTQLKREYTDIQKWTLPTTLLTKEGKEISRLQGAYLYPHALGAVIDKLILGSHVYISENGRDIEAIIKSIVNDSYILQANGNTIQVPKEKIKWTSNQH